MSDGQSEELEQLAADARELESRIVTERKGVQRAGWKLGALLHAAREERAWELLGHESEEKWLDSPEIDIRYSTAKALMQVFREVCIERGVTVERVQEMDTRKVQMVLPAVRDGKVTMDDALSDVEVLTRDDLKLKYKGDPNKAIDSGKGDGKVECNSCGSWVEPEKLKGAA